MRKLLLPFALVLSLAVPGFAQERAREAPASRRAAPNAEASRELPPGLQRLEGRRQVDDAALRRQFDRAVGLLIEIQKREIEVDTELLRELRERRTQRRTPLGARGDFNDTQPAHIPSLEVLRTPLS